MEYVLEFPIIFEYIKEIEEEYKKFENCIDITKNGLMIKMLVQIHVY